MFLSCADKFDSKTGLFIAVWELKFHASHPDNLFSCSEDGSVWHWDGSNINSAAPGVKGECGDFQA